LPLLPRPEISRLTASYHGGPDHAELKALGLTPGDVIDFSVCSNPFAPPVNIGEAARGIAINRYPDSESTEFRESLSKRLGVPVDNIIAGSGSTELLRMAALAYFKPGDRVLIPEPAFGEYRLGCEIMGTEIITRKAKEEDGFAFNIGDIIKTIKNSRPAGVFICNPNNPTGNYLDKKSIESILDAGDETLIILDEAYISFVEEIWNSPALIDRENLLIVRSMTKDHALTGLRLGYAIAHRKIIDTLRLVKPPWNINAVAQEIGKLTLDGADRMEYSRAEMRKTKNYLIKELGRLGYKAVPSDTNYFLVKVGNASAFRAALLRKKIMVRNCASFGLPDYVRIAARTMPECEKLIAAIETICHAGGSPDSIGMTEASQGGEETSNTMRSND